jgi:cytochrome c peroxidase
MNKTTGWIGFSLAGLMVLQGCDGSSDSPNDSATATGGLDADVRAAATAASVTGDPARGRDLPSPDDPLAKLGRALFFTKGLGGDEDAACVTCHHPMLGGGDGIALSIGVHAEDPDLLGRGRVHSQADALAAGSEFDGGPTVPRNAPTTFNIALWDAALFHDGRVESLGKTFGTNGDDGQGIRTPDSAFGTADPDAGENLTWAQARFPITSPEEMRGFDLAAGQSNDELRAALEERFVNDENYAGWLAAFRKGFDRPNASAEELLTASNIARAIGEYERSQLLTQTPWNAYLSGDDQAIRTDAKRGALLFFTAVSDGGAGCSSCHSSDFFTDEAFHVLAVPQIGRGKGDGGSAVEGSDDFGRFRETGDPADMYAFRTPTLLNVEVTAPYGHSGAFADLEGIVRHHLDPEQSIDDYFINIGARLGELEYSGYRIQADHAETNTRNALDQLRANRASGKPGVIQNASPSDADVEDLIAFLKTLTDPRTLSRDGMDPWLPDPLDADPDGLRLRPSNRL